MKGVEDKRRYLIEVKIGKAKGLLASMLRLYWTNRVDAMKEGQVLDEYYKAVAHD